MTFNMDAPKVNSLTLPNYKKIKIAAVAVVLAAAAFAGGLALAMLQSPTVVPVPDDIKQKLAFVLFVPRSLPGTFAINESSFTIQEGTVLFRAADNTGASLVFTEQKKPADFNFSDFYENQMKNAQMVDGTKYSTVVGKSTDESVTLVSIVAEDTWVLISSKLPLNQDNAKTISQSLVKS